MEKPNFTKIKALLKEGTSKKWMADYSSICIDGYSIHGIDSNDAALIVELRNNIEGIMEYCEWFEKEINEICIKHGIG